MLRAADAAIDIEAMRVTLWNAAWLFDSDRDAADAVGVAKWQASERGQRTVHATQHLHGGWGPTSPIPIHRYFLWGSSSSCAGRTEPAAVPPRRAASRPPGRPGRREPRR